MVAVQPLSGMMTESRMPENAALLDEEIARTVQSLQQYVGPKDSFPRQHSHSKLSRTFQELRRSRRALHDHRYRTNELRHLSVCTRCLADAGVLHLGPFARRRCLSDHFLQKLTDRYSEQLKIDSISAMHLKWLARGASGGVKMVQGVTVRSGGTHAETSFAPVSRSFHVTEMRS